MRRREMEGGVIERRWCVCGGGGAGDSHTKAVGWKEPNAGAN